MVQQNTEVYF